MRGKTFFRFAQRTFWGFAVALVLIAVLVPIRGVADELSPADGERQKTELPGCKFLMEKAARELRGIGEALQGRSWVQRRKLKEITAQIEAISDKLEQSSEETEPKVHDRGAPSGH
jgi:hypothetical protein